MKNKRSNKHKGDSDMFFIFTFIVNNKQEGATRYQQINHVLFLTNIFLLVAFRS
ncbi:unnamed protein product [Brassica napus]|uniref:(rape) hypothetical protein n=1 Tax=Brassica napus TaxID=3708 RepID=A0A816XVK4_BRANA|nr:unnamed protein product [Brassica napus]